MKPLAIDLCCGLGGWADGLIAEGWDVIGYDIERHDYGKGGYPGQLILQDIRTLDGSQFKGAASLVVASPPCTEYAYMAMPWKRGKQIAAALRGKGAFPENYKGSRTISELTALFDACVRIGRQAECPTIIENVCGAQPWVGTARWAFGSFYLWGDVPALMPIPGKSRKTPVGSWDTTRKNYTSDHSWKGEGNKTAGIANKRDGYAHTKHLTCQKESAGVKQPGIGGLRDNGKGDAWFQNGAARSGSKSNARKQASAEIAKIPPALAQWIAKCFRHDAPTAIVAM
jgi:site-specific DNA-cytosine methylase